MHGEDDFELEDGEAVLHGVPDEDDKNQEANDGVTPFGVICGDFATEGESDEAGEEGEVVTDPYAYTVDVCVTDDRTRVFFVVCEL